MKKIILEIRKAIAVMYLKNAMTACPDGEFKTEFAKFINQNIFKL